MHRDASPRFLPLLALLVLVGCGDAPAQRGATDDGAASLAGDAAPSATSPAPGGGGDDFEVTLTGPSRPGTHRGSGDLRCMVFNGLWQASWEAPAATGLSGLLLQLKEVPASGGSSDKLSFTAVFGSQVEADGVTAMIDVHGSEFGRDGRGTVVREGSGAAIHIEGTAQQGGRVTAVLRCASVDVMS